MKRVFLFLLILTVLFCFGCPEKPAEDTEQPEEVVPYTPPADGRITAEQQGSYIKASLALQEAMEKYSLMIKEFVEKYKLNQDLTQMSDTAFLNSNPDVKKAWGELNKEWDEMQREAYKVAGISEEEFNWIGGALTDIINTAVQKKVEKALTIKPEETN